MTHKVHMVLDLQYGSTGKGLIAGWLAKREGYDTAICAFSANAGHTYIDRERQLHVMTQQLPTAITSPSVKHILIGPGAAICPKTFMAEVMVYEKLLQGKKIFIHPHAAFIRDEHSQFEMTDGRTKMGSTAKGVGEAYIERIRRGPAANVVANLPADHPMRKYVCTVDDYRGAIDHAESVLIEGAQGYSLSLYHGQYPFVTSRDVTPWQIAADCGLPYKWASYVKVIGTLRTFPIRVNNRDGSSGPCYPDQQEIQWSDIGVMPELTTVTKLPRRLFTFSKLQLEEAMFHCGGYWETSLFLNFANYLPDQSALDHLIGTIEEPTVGMLNPPKVVWTGFGPDDSHVKRLDPNWAWEF